MLNDYQMFFQESPVINLIIGVDQVILKSNKAVSRILGYAQEDVINKPIGQFVVPWHQQIVSDVFSGILRGETSPEIDVDVYAANGSVHTILFASDQIRLKDGDSLIGVLVSGIDITERKLVSETLSETEQNYQRLIDTMNEGFCIQDNHGIITYVNDRFSKMVGYQREELLGENAARFLSTDSAEEMQRISQGVGLTGVESLDLIWNTKNGAHIHTIL